MSWAFDFVEDTAFIEFTSAHRIEIPDESLIGWSMTFGRAFRWLVQPDSVRGGGSFE